MKVTDLSDHNDQKFFTILMKLGMYIGSTPWFYLENLRFSKRILCKGLTLFALLLNFVHVFISFEFFSKNDGICSALSAMWFLSLLWSRLIIASQVMNKKKWKSLQNHVNTLCLKLSSKDVPASGRSNIILFMMGVKCALLMFLMLNQTWQQDSWFEQFCGVLEHLQYSYEIISIYFILDIINRKYENVINIAKGSRNNIIHNIISDKYFDELISCLKIIKQTSLCFTDLHGLFILSYMASFSILVLHSVNCSYFGPEFGTGIKSIPFLINVICLFMVILKCDKIIEAYGKLIQQAASNMEYQIFCNPSVDERKEKSLKKFLDAIELNKLHFSCQGYINLDKKICITLLAILTNFLIITLQLKGVHIERSK